MCTGIASVAGLICTSAGSSSVAVFLRSCAGDFIQTLVCNCLFVIALLFGTVSSVSYGIIWILIRLYVAFVWPSSLFGCLWKAVIFMAFNE